MGFSSTGDSAICGGQKRTIRHCKDIRRYIGTFQGTLIFAGLVWGGQGSEPPVPQAPKSFQVGLGWIVVHVFPRPYSLNPEPETLNPKPYSEAFCSKARGVLAFWAVTTTRFRAPVSLLEGYSYWFLVGNVGIYDIGSI